MRIPGVVWVVLLTGLPLVIELIERQYGGEHWAELTAGVLIILLAVVKAVQTYSTPAAPNGERPQFEAAPASEQPSRARTLLLG